MPYWYFPAWLETILPLLFWETPYRKVAGKEFCDSNIMGSMIFKWTFYLPVGHSKYYVWWRWWWWWTQNSPETVCRRGFVQTRWGADSTPPDSVGGSGEQTPTTGKGNNGKWGKGWKRRIKGKRRKREERIDEKRQSSIHALLFHIPALTPTDNNGSNEEAPICTGHDGSVFTMH